MAQKHKPGRNKKLYDPDRKLDADDLRFVPPTSQLGSTNVGKALRELRNRFLQNIGSLLTAGALGQILLSQGVGNNPTWVDHDADIVNYDNTVTGELSATEVQGAIDELSDRPEVREIVTWNNMVVVYGGKVVTYE